LGKQKEGLADLYAIETAEIFPKDLLQNIIIPTLTIAQKEHLFEQNFYISATGYKKFESSNTFLQSMSVDMSQDEYIDFGDLSKFIFQLK
jgi:hypothetical protein